MNTEKKQTTATYLNIKVHQLASYYLTLERMMVLDTSNYDDEEGFASRKYIPYRIKIRFEGSYSNDINTTKESRITDKREVWYEFDYGKINELRRYSDKEEFSLVTEDNKIVDSTNFQIMFYNLETKIKEILSIEKRIKQRNQEKKTKFGHLTEYDRLLLKKEERKLKNLKKTYMRELIGIAKEHLFFIENSFENKEEDGEIITEKELIIPGT